MSQIARGGAPPNRISSEEVFVSCAGHPSREETGEETGEGRGEEEKGKGKGTMMIAKFLFSLAEVNLRIEVGVLDQGYSADASFILVGPLR